MPPSKLPDSTSHLQNFQSHMHPDDRQTDRCGKGGSGPVLEGPPHSAVVAFSTLSRAYPCRRALSLSDPGKEGQTMQLTGQTHHRKWDTQTIPRDRDSPWVWAASVESERLAHLRHAI